MMNFEAEGSRDRRPGTGRGAVASLALLAAFALGGPLGAQTTAADTITVAYEEKDGIALLGITDVAVALEASQTGIALIPGERFTAKITEGAKNGGRLHFTVHGLSGSMKLTVRTPTPITAGSFKVAIVAGPNGGEGERGTVVGGQIALSATAANLITGIGDCYTATGLNEGFLVWYSLVGNPGYAMGDVEIEYSLVAGS